MLNKFRNAQGFTLIELMIVVAILGILAAVAVPAFLKYIHDSKTAEAKENLKAIGDGAITFYQEEHADPADTLAVITRVYPGSANLPAGVGAAPTCTAGNDPDGKKVSPADALSVWDEWKPLRFQLSKAHYYKYCYAHGAQALAGTEGFTAGAGASLSATLDSTFYVEGGESDDGPVVGAITEGAGGFAF